MENSFIDFNNEMKEQEALRNMPIIVPKRNITIFKYIANKVPADAHFTLNKYAHYRKARNEKELEGQLKHFVSSFGTKGLQAIADIHPDRQLLSSLECESCKTKEKDYNNLLITKQISDSQPLYFNANGEKNELMIKKINTSLIVVGGFIVLGLALIINLKK